MSASQKMDAFIADYHRRTGMSGSLRITRRDEVILERFIGMADREHGVPLTSESIFTLYSLSKPFCAIGLLLLRDAGKVDIDRHPGVYVPEAQGFDPRVTIRHLLQHVSGLPDFEQDQAFSCQYPPAMPEEIRAQLRLLTAYPQRFVPGTAGFYANINYILCALIIENVTGLSYADYMRTAVFGPLGMPAAQVDRADLHIPHRVQGYHPENGTIVPVDRALGWLFGAGDIVGTLDDVYCLNRAIKHRLLLKPETWAEALTPSPVNRMGMGCTVTQWHGKTRITHNGGHTGFRTLHIQLPGDDFDVILLSNCGWGDMRTDFTEAIHDIFYGQNEAPCDSFHMDAGYIRA